jgi:RND superfamily putative drug exporter
LRSEAGDAALVLASIPGDDDAVDTVVADLVDRYTRADATVEVAVTGGAAIFHSVGDTIEADLLTAELIALPITLVLLFLVFRGVVAALLPLAVGVLAVLGTFLVLTVIASLTEVSIFALNLTTALGLGLAIDYSLFVVSRYREELADGAEPPDALRRTLTTAGRTVLFSAGTVAASLAALLIFPLAFLRSFAYAGISVVAVAAIGSVVVLPALLAVLGRRVDAWSLPRRSRPEGHVGVWHRIATTVMRRPLPIATVVVVVLLVLGSPFLGIRFGLPDDRVLPADDPARAAYETIRTDFGGQESAPLEVVALGTGDPTRRLDDVATYAAALSAVEGVARVDSLAGSHVAGALVAPAGPTAERFAAADGTWWSVIPSVEPISSAGEQLVADVRALDSPFDTQVAGRAAQLVDTKASLFGLVPWAAAIIGLVTFGVLFMMFGSLLVPVKAVILNLLSLTATFGAMVWIFQDGNLSGVLDFTATGTIDTTTPILMFCIAFGLSMDYEVFLLSRIKEEHDRGRSTQESVALGLERTGPIVTAAALLISVVFLAFATSRVTFMILFGLGLALAVLLDASLVRATLVPSFMRLAGEANWWAPRPLRRLHERWGFTEASGDDGPSRPAAPDDELDVREPDLVGAR